jgi:hypothetical protein
MKGDRVSAQSVASYEERMETYRIEMRRFMRNELSWMFVVSVVVNQVVAYVMVRHVLPDESIPTHQWMIVGFVVAVALMVPLIMVMKPHRPQPGDVQLDRELHRKLRR